MFFLPFLLLVMVIFFIAVVFLFALIQVGAITVAFTKLGLSTQQVFWILIFTLLGSMVNIPFYRKQAPVRKETFSFKGLWSHYRTPRFTSSSYPAKQILAVNLGGGLIPCILSIYFLSQIGITLGLILCLGIVIFSTFKLAKPVPGVGIGIPFLIPPLITVLAVWLLAPAGQQPQIAYIAGSLGTLIGADILHLINKKNLQKLQAPMLSIGGAGTFDGIFLSGILAVLLA